MIKQLKNDRHKSSEAAVVSEQLADAEVPGFQAEFSPEEAELAGAFVEDALSEADALESAIDLVDINPTSPSNP